MRTQVYRVTNLRLVRGGSSRFCVDVGIERFMPFFARLETENSRCSARNPKSAS